MCLESAAMLCKVRPAPALTPRCLLHLRIPPARYTAISGAWAVTIAPWPVSTTDVLLGMALIGGVLAGSCEDIAPRSQFRQRLSLAFLGTCIVSWCATAWHMQSWLADWAVNPNYIFIHTLVSLGAIVAMLTDALPARSSRTSAAKPARRAWCAKPLPAR